MKVFLQTMAKKAIHETFLLRMILNICTAFTVTILYIIQFVLETMSHIIIIWNELITVGTKLIWP